MTSRTDRIRLRLLGGFSLRVGDGEDVTIASKKARGLLTYLALTHGKSASREQIAAMFWPDNGDKEARQSLRQALSALRRALGADAGNWLHADGGQIALASERIEVDVDLVLDALASTHDDHALTASEYAVGPLLPDHTFGVAEIDDWLRDARVRVRDACRRLLFRCVDTPSLDDERRIDIYWQVLGIEPACEEAHRGLMRAYAQTSRRSQALSQFQACADALARHLDATPSQATAQLFEELRDSNVPAPADTRPATLPLPPKPSIAVLAFANLSGDERHDYLCDGISEDITTFLSQFSSLYVMSRTTATAFKGTTQPIPEIGRQLGVHYVLEGSVRLAGDRIRVTAQLTEAEHGGQVWSNRYEGKLDDVFAFQDDIAQRIVATAAGRIEAEALNRARRKAARDLDAYDYVLRGKYHHHRCTPEDSYPSGQPRRDAMIVSP